MTGTYAVRGMREVSLEKGPERFDKWVSELLWVHLLLALEDTHVPGHAAETTLLLSPSM